MHRLCFVGVHFAHMPTRTHQGWLSTSNVSTFQQKRWETRNSSQNQPPPHWWMKRCHSVLSHPTTISQEDFFLSHPWQCWHLNANRASVPTAPWTPSRLGAQPRGTAPIPSPWETLPAPHFKGVPRGSGCRFDSKLGLTLLLLQGQEEVSSQPQPTRLS